MKKIFTLLVAVSLFSVSFAQNSRSHEQQNNRPDNHKQQVNNSRRPNDHNQNAVHYTYQQDNHRYNDRDRQREIDQINRECDQQIYSYRNDRSISNYERNRRISRVESQRSVRLSSFGTGAIIGATAGILLGAILSH